ncbi:MAG: two-component system, OmpR family, sensor histidine kinase MprB, partial [Thermoleophilaceae bacterium]|nr:two-component system, OmpR family, sensor histidine kinase MprB [Thermoleophilaceae bacterium]
MSFSLRNLSLRGRIAGVAGLAVAVAVLLGAALAYVAIRSELRGQVDNALRDTAARFVGVNSAGPAGPGPGGAMPADGPDRVAARILFGPHGPPGYRDFRRTAPAFGGATGYVQVVTPDGSVLRPQDETGELPAGSAGRAIAANGSGQQLADAQVGGNHLRVLTIGVGGLGAVQIARPLAEVDSML